MFKINQDLRYHITEKKYFSTIERMLKKENFTRFNRFNRKIEIVVRLNEYDEESLKEIERLSELIPNFIKTSIIIDDRQANLKCSELNRFIDLEEFFEDKNTNLFFGNSQNKYTLNEVVYAQKQIADFSSNLKSLDASPFEKYLIIYDFLTNKIYKENRKFGMKARDVVSILNGDDIVCVGYSRLMARLCREVGIECYEQSLDVYLKNGKCVGGHANNIVRIKDEKYGIDGLFYADACFDSIKKVGDNKTYSYCLIPLQDKNALTEGVLEAREGFNQFFYDRDTESLFSYCNDVSAYKEYGIECEEIDKNQFNDDFVNKDRRLMACKRLKGILENNNIPSDIFKLETHIPAICSVERMLALCMEENIDEKRLNESIKVLKDFVSLGKNFYKDRRCLRMKFSSNETKKDIFEKIDEYACSQTDIKDVYGSTKELIETMDTHDAEAIRQILDKHVPQKWKKVLDEYSNIHHEREIKKYIQQMIDKSENVSLNVFKDALIRSYKLRGVDSETAKNKAISNLSATIKKSNEEFNESAQNCFKQSAIQLKLSTNDNDQMER